ncbi:bifunctional hydroxymethylpyrimidine kinase/phosphomethylpyrimidine kinase [Methanosphaera sp. ISO3-F5]|uniref:bifunctional hydroxymethylpyrimidine kinase/phosphomethylpyrimidine kinase n=1 Tax=Methanosphaera sp. ISO3-F5 TaxID=1452353 RepID=UPI002B25F6A4|nr:bifunctional hydroxymethylpyrimidine kinase/phosphomethylpyrimidine kinase [Methanosphaera sp. ISO3-F5]WQH64712.1 bifunctional hydroxymethylpyrimidine kinase/phosphomethylpyrimidine kinase [Methanosphaera sp. ISO3-F5]
MSHEMRDNCSLSIAGLDPSGGAGILADCKTFHAHGIYANCVVTCITAQNPFGVINIQEVDLDVLCDEIDQVLSVYPIEYIKTGMLYSSEIIKLVSGKIREYGVKAVVDPVMISESGSDLTKLDYPECLKKDLLKESYLITPNIHEAEQLSGKQISNEEDMKSVAEYLGKKTNVVITGGHLNGNDILYYEDEIHNIEGKLIPSKNTHGTGCTYSTAITSNLIKKYDIIESCKKSNNFIQEAIKNGYNYTPNQFYKK